MSVKLGEKAEQWGPTTLAIAVVLMAAESRMSSAGGGVIDEKVAQLQSGFAEFTGEIKGAVSRMEDVTTELRISKAVSDEIDAAQTKAIADLINRVQAIEDRP